ncbi:UshA 5'-nucleotidase/2',3'-cyclic phosphodiesterase and related esterases [Candidatus Planktophila versatilis]
MEDTLKIKNAIAALAVTALVAPMSLADASTFTDTGSPVTLTILHNNDGESALLPEQSYTLPQGKLIYGSAAAFSTVMKREISSAKNRGNAVVSLYAGDSFLASKTLICSDPANSSSTTPVYDGLAQSMMPYDAHILGNHEFDYGTGFLNRYINSFTQKLRYQFLSGNLDFSKNADLSPMTSKSGQIIRARHTGKKVGQSYVHKDYATGAIFGVVSAVTPTLRTISSPGTTKVTTIDIPATAALLNKQVEALEAQGVNKIILVSHLQGVAYDKELVALLKNVDVAVAGGGDDLLTSPDVAESIQLIPGEGKPVGKYPEMVKDADGVDVPLITTKGNYNYLGRFDISFDADGKLSSYNKTTSYPRRVIPYSSVAGALGVTDAVAPDKRIVEAVEKPLNTCLTGFAKPIASSQIVLATDRGSATVLGVRTAETNGGNLVADSFVQAYSSRAAAAGLPAAGTANPLVAVQNGGGIRQGGGTTLPTTGVVGAINRGNTFDLLPFDNRLVAVTNVSATDMKEIFERSCSVSTSGGGQFLQFSGMKVSCSRTESATVISTPTGDAYAGTITTPGKRVKEITLSDGRALVKDGAVVAGAPAVTIVTNQFTADGGDNYPTFQKLTKVGFGISYEQALYDYLLSFAKNSAGLPEIPASDARYSKTTGEGRFTWLP